MHLRLVANLRCEQSKLDRLLVNVCKRSRMLAFIERRADIYLKGAITLILEFSVVGEWNWLLIYFSVHLLRVLALKWLNVVINVENLNIFY